MRGCVVARAALGVGVDWGVVAIDENREVIAFPAENIPDESRVEFGVPPLAP